MVYQLICTIIAVILNVFLITLIITKSPKQTGKYKYLMIFTTLFEIFWAVFDLPAAIIAHSVGCAFVVFRVNIPDSLITPELSNWMILIYTAIFGASMAIFAGHFIYRFGSINNVFGKKFTSGWKFYLLFFIPMVYSLWWGTVVRTWFWRNGDMDEYTRHLIMETVNQDVENVSYIGAKFYNTGENGTETWNASAWIGVSQMWFMVISSMTCVFGFGTMCYLRLSNTLSQSSFSQNLQKQLFYALVAQTAIPLFLMHIPITIYFLCPMLDLDFDFASSFVASTITLYPAVDPLPTFCIIKNYRDATWNMLKRVIRCRKTRVAGARTIPIPSISVSAVHQLYQADW